jgi:hypothetical protein
MFVSYSRIWKLGGVAIYDAATDIQHLPYFINSDLKEFFWV